jgi:hypothetical protein
MYGPNRAVEVWPAARHENYAGICRSDCALNPDFGWFVPYRQVPGYVGAYEAVINLRVIDLHSGSIGTVPFVIDTGTDATIIPRGWLAHSAFPRTEALGYCQLSPVIGPPVFG